MADAATAITPRLLVRFPYHDVEQQLCALQEKQCPCALSSKSEHSNLLPPSRVAAKAA